MGKARETTSRVELPESLERGSEEVIAAAMRSAALPYSPNRGVTIAAMAPQQRAAMTGANNAAAAFGLPTGDANYLPTPTTGAGGVKGYSTGALYDQMLGQSTTSAQRALRDAILRSYGTASQNILPNEDVASAQEAANQPRMRGVAGGK